MPETSGFKVQFCTKLRSPQASSSPAFIFTDVCRKKGHLSSWLGAHCSTSAPHIPELASQPIPHLRPQRSSNLHPTVHKTRQKGRSKDGKVIYLSIVSQPEAELDPGGRYFLHPQLHILPSIPKFPVRGHLRSSQEGNSPAQSPQEREMNTPPPDRNPKCTLQT